MSEESKLTYKGQEFNHNRKLSSFRKQLSILSKAGFRPIGVSQMMFEDTFVFETMDEAQRGYNTLEQSEDGEWVGKVVGWWYGRADYAAAIKEYEKKMECKVLTHWLKHD